MAQIYTSPIQVRTDLSKRISENFKWLFLINDDSSFWNDDNTLLETHQPNNENSPLLGDTLSANMLRLDSDKILPYEEPLECKVVPQSPKFAGITFEERVHPLFSNPDSFFITNFEYQNSGNSKNIEEWLDLDQNELNECDEAGPAQTKFESPNVKHEVDTVIVDAGEQQAEPEIYNEPIPKGDQLEDCSQNIDNISVCRNSTSMTHWSWRHENGINLHNRRDVINKTLIRSAKRYFTDKFEEFLWANKINKIQKKAQWKEYVEDFTKHILKDRIKASDKTKNYKLKDVYALMAAMVIHHRVKKSDKRSSYYEISELFTATLYRYTLNRLNHFLKQPYVSFVFKFYFEDGPFSELLKSDSTLSKHPDLYLESCKEMSEILYNPERSIHKVIN